MLLIINNNEQQQQIIYKNKKWGIELRDGFGEKIQSSSWLIKGSKK